MALCLMEIERLALSLRDITIFPIPSDVANDLWGCFVVTNSKQDPLKMGSNQLCQRVSTHLFIPEKTILWPGFSLDEINELLASASYVVHPDFGWVALKDELKLEQLVKLPKMKSYYITKPEDPVFIPNQIKSFQVKPVPPEQDLRNMEQTVFPQREPLKDKPLTLWEKSKLNFYKLMFKKDRDQKTGEAKPTQKRPITSKLESFLSSVFKTQPNWIEDFQQNFEELERRNQKQVDKLMDLLKNNPEEALRYAIPLNKSGTTRGVGSSGDFGWNIRWPNLSLFGTSSNSGGMSIDIGDEYYKLRKQYEATARRLIAEKKYRKAAFVYMKLLRHYLAAAKTMEAGKHYQEAATIYLKHCGDKIKAADCYEKGNMTQEAIAIHKELNNNEKVGDLYLSIGNKDSAYSHYQMVINDYKSLNQYLKASFIYKDKMRDTSKAQALLLDGWKTKQDAFNCLNQYFTNFEDNKLLQTEIDRLYADELEQHDKESFLRAIEHVHRKNDELAGSLKELAYKIVSSQIENNPHLVNQLKGFTPNDKELVKDTMRFKINLKKKPR